MTIAHHPQRQTIWHELHARPYVRFSGPAHVLRLSYLVGEGGEDFDRESLLRLTEALGIAATYETPMHVIYATTIPRFGRLVLSWERHSELVAYTFYLYALEIPFRPFGFDFMELIPGGWLNSLPTSPLVASRVAVGSRSDMPDTPEGLIEIFEGHTVNGSRVMAGRAEAWSCYRAHRDGFGRIAVIVDQMSPQEQGRTVERLLAIEDYYHLVLFSLPLAREVKPGLASAERRMVLEMDALRGAESLEKKRAVLDALLALAAAVEHLRARVSNRFAASSAYFSLLESRFGELREAKIEHVLPLNRFVMRRVRPAAETYRSLLERLANLSERINRASDLLRTGIELCVEEQNQRLLESADRRARLQLRLQEAVESLSVVVVTYYVLALVGYAFKGLKSRGFDFDLDATIGLAVPIVLLAVIGAVYLVHRHFRDRP